MAMLTSFRNLLSVAVNPLFQSAKGIQLQTDRRYGEALELEYYGNEKNWAFLPQEIEIFDELNLRGPLDLLVVGCGAGREFSKLGMHRLYGVDSCDRLLQLCQKQFPEVILCTNLDSLFTKFDVIYISFHVYNHIQGKENRIGFLKALKEMLKVNGEIYLHTDEFDLRDGYKFQLASFILRLRWFISGISWEKGDTVRAYNGDHNPFGRIFFYHYFLNEDDVLGEMISLDMKIVRKNNYWRLIKN